MENELLVIKNDDTQISTDVAKKIKSLLKKKKECEELEKQLKDLFLKEMEARKLKKVTKNNISVTYVAATTQENFDKDKFRKENESLYNKYVKFSPKKAFVKIEVKDEWLKLGI